MHCPHPCLVVNLTDRCNKASRYCNRTAVPVERGFHLNQKEAMAAVDDASSLGYRGRQRLLKGLSHDRCIPSCESLRVSRG
jgi:molybdenum cofactor biosynthesis enzyme MoaA